MVWSVGCILAELHTGAPLFRSDTEIEQLYCIFRLLGTPTNAQWRGVTKLPFYAESTFPKWPPQALPVGGAAGDLLGALLAYNPAHRSSASDALAHPYLAAAAAVWAKDTR